jgi:hypothetical protein
MLVCFLKRWPHWVAGLLVWWLLPMGAAGAAVHIGETAAPPVPRSLESYQDAHLTSLVEVLQHRVEQEPFNLWATIFFVGAIVHTFFTHKFRHWSHVLEKRHRERLRAAHQAGGGDGEGEAREAVSMPARILHFLGEVEAVFGIWVVPLFFLMELHFGDPIARGYLAQWVNYDEAIFVVVIMALSATRPILRLAENALRFVAGLGGGRPAAWWLAILTIGPIMGSFVTEPAAMTISASLLARQFYVLRPRLTFAYATLGLLFVNISVGGTLTHFAAPPVLMVADAWGWNTGFMFRNFGWIAFVGIVIANSTYFVWFRKEFAALKPPPSLGGEAGVKGAPVPVWVTVAHMVFMAAAVANAHYPPVLMGVFLFFLAFYQVTEDHQARLELRSPVLVGFFLAGLVIHGGLQQWWIAPVLSRLEELPLMLGAIALTAFNDNAAITYLATLVPGMTAGMKFAVVAGAVTGGGLTVIANAPNPAGQSILNRYFPNGISPLGLFLGALVPTVILALCFMLLG